MSNVKFSVFTKPWKEPIDRLAERVSSLGFDGIELPVRPGYPVTPEVVHELPTAIKRLRDHGVEVFSIAGPTDERTFAACAESGVPMIRVMASIGAEGYIAAEQKLQREYDALLPLLDKYRVKIGVQNHYGKFVSNASGLRTLIGEYNPAHIGIVWDAAHNALNGEEMEFGIEIVWSHLCMVNLKNAIWRRTNVDDEGPATWSPYWTSGTPGLASWPRVSTELKRRKYSGVVCLTAEYSEEAEVDRLIATDIKYARSLFACD